MLLLVNLVFILKWYFLMTKNVNATIWDSYYNDGLASVSMKTV